MISIPVRPKYNCSYFKNHNRIRRKKLLPEVWLEPRHGDTVARDVRCVGSNDGMDSSRAVDGSTKSPWACHLRT